MSAVVEITVDNRVSDKVANEKSESETVSEFETVNAKETGGESVKLETIKMKLEVCVT
jgi:hypothetical protein